jgi:hypothetical protein
MNRIRSGSRIVAVSMLICLMALMSRVAFADLSGPGAPPPPPPGSKG